MSYRELLAPEAKELVDKIDLSGGATTKDDYGTVLNFTLRAIPADVRNDWIDALVDAGYPADTGETLKRLL